MKNILSYKSGSIFSGKEIKDWISYNIKYRTSHYKQAVQMLKYLTVKDDTNYIIKLCHQGTGGNETVHSVTVVRCNKEMNVDE